MKRVTIAGAIFAFALSTAPGFSQVAPPPIPGLDFVPVSISAEIVCKTNKAGNGTALLSGSVSFADLKKAVTVGAGTILGWTMAGINDTNVASANIPCGAAEAIVNANAVLAQFLCYDISLEGIYPGPFGETVTSPTTTFALGSTGNTVTRWNLSCDQFGR